MNINNELKDKIIEFGQEQLLANFDKADNDAAEKYVSQLEKIDFQKMNDLFKNAEKAGENSARVEFAPVSVKSAENLSNDERNTYYNAGIDAIKNGLVEAVTMAGGQGSRLGHNGPKGTFDIGLDSHKSLFEIQCDGLKKIEEKTGVFVRWNIMTSETNNAETISFFEEHAFFGYPKEKITFFTQNMLPALDKATGKILRSDDFEIANSPDGNGGMFAALETSGVLKRDINEGIKWVFICGIDNCLVKMCDPLFIGYTILSGRKASAKTFMKRSADEKAGVICFKNGKPGVIEYTEVPKEIAGEKDAEGNFVYGDANVLNYVFSIDVLDNAANGLPYHTAIKKVAYINDNGIKITPTEPNAYKFELFLFDIFDYIDDIVAFRINREKEFAPVKNKEGEDSPATARRLYSMANKIKMENPIVEMDGDEMTRIIWQKIKEKILCPFVELNTEYYDLSIQNRDKTDDEVTKQAANAVKTHKVAVKCATITPNAARVAEFGLKKMWKSPNGTIRSILDGTVFRAPLIADGIEPLVKCWKKPIVIARHAYGDIYSAVETKIEKGNICYLTIKDAEGNVIDEKSIHEFKDTDGIIMGMHNEEKSIAGFARACFEYALSVGYDLWFSAKDTISKTYDHRFKDIFLEIYENEYKEKFEKKGITYFYTLVDDAVSRVMRSEGGFVWACKNYDGDVFSDMLASAFGSLSMMTSVLVSPYGYFEYEAAHGTIPRHYHKYLNGEPTSTNPIATIYAWTGALAKKGDMDGNNELVAFAKKIENAVMELIAKGKMTGDLAKITTKENVQVLNLDEFLDAIAEKIS